MMAIAADLEPPRLATPMLESVESWPLATLSGAQKSALADLLTQVWPDPLKDHAYRVRRLEQRGREPMGPDGQVPTAYVIRAGQKILASALTFARPILLAGEPKLALALCYVAVDPASRGQKFGEKVVQAAFAQVDAKSFNLALFQTSENVRPFYQRLGAEVVENSIIDSTSDEPGKNPFWDEVVMRYPATGDWPSGVIDLCGAGY
jgi:ribosomal protein S18 acetylase RimI-like enzyme